MSKISQYQYAKQDLKGISKNIKEIYRDDKPAIRMHINDSINWVSANYDLTDHKNSLLHDYACTLHP